MTNYKLLLRRCRIELESSTDLEIDFVRNLIFWWAAYNMQHIFSLLSSNWFLHPFWESKFFNKKRYSESDALSCKLFREMSCRPISRIFVGSFIFWKMPNLGCWTSETICVVRLAGADEPPLNTPNTKTIQMQRPN